MAKNSLRPVIPYPTLAELLEVTDTQQDVLIFIDFASILLTISTLGLYLPGKKGSRSMLLMAKNSQNKTKIAAAIFNRKKGGRHIIIQIKEYNVLQKKSLGHRVNPTV